MKFLTSKLATALTLLIVVACIAVVMVVDARHPFAAAAGLVAGLGAVALSLSRSLIDVGATAAIAPANDVQKDQVK